MNKIGKVILSILGGMDVIMYLLTPIAIVLLLLAVSSILNNPLNKLSSIIFIIASLGSTIFRAIKIGWMK